MNRRDFIKACGALGAAVSGWAGWSRAQAAEERSVSQVTPDASTFRLIGPQTGMWRDMGMLDNKDAGFTMTHTDETLRGMSVPFAVAGEGRFSLVDDDGTALHVYLPVVRDGK
jgi:hypothetical protein